MGHQEQWSQGHRRGLTSSSFSSVPSVLMLTPVSRAQAASTLCLVSTARPVLQATKAHGCLEWASTMPEPANRSGWVECVNKRAWPCRGQGFLGWPWGSCDKWARLLTHLLALHWFWVWASGQCSQLRPHQCPLPCLRRPTTGLVLPKVCPFRSATMLMNATTGTTVAATQTPSAPIQW